jgi:hypothetical protein
MRKIQITNIERSSILSLKYQPFLCKIQQKPYLIFISITYNLENGERKPRYVDKKKTTVKQDEFWMVDGGSILIFSLVSCFGR